jgi:hypothetical protein
LIFDNSVVDFFKFSQHKNCESGGSWWSRSQETAAGSRFPFQTCKLAYQPLVEWDSFRSAGGKRKKIEGFDSGSE